VRTLSISHGTNAGWQSGFKLVAPAACAFAGKVYEASEGALVVYNGVTRGTRIAKLAPGTTIRVEVVGTLRRAYAGEPKIGDRIP
jgi:hypothetical protein